MAGNADRCYDRNPSWRIFRMEWCDPYGWHRLGETEVERIRGLLVNLESRTWNEILVASNKQNHAVDIADLSKEARDRLVELKLDDADKLVSLRLTARERVWGLFREGVMDLLWYDPMHQVCPSMMRNT